MTTLRAPRSRLLSHAVRNALLSLPLCLGTLGASAQSEPPAAVAARHYDIPAGPLAAALTRFAADAGIALSVDATLVAGLHSPGIRGTHELAPGFAALLRGTGLEAARAADGQWTLRPAPRHTHVLGEVVVLSPPDSLGTRVLGRDTLDALGRGNGDITSALRVLPNVQFDNNQLHTGRQGEIAPADVSIHGGRYYNNLFQMDGMSFNNDINPAQRASDGIVGTNNNSAPPSAAQGFAIDTSLLCRVTVRDSNVPAEFGRFSGGVISADTCAPTRSFGGQFSVERTRSQWTEYQLTPAQRESYAQSATANEQPEFDKINYRLALEGRPTENLGLIASIVRKTSEIPLRAYSSGRSSSSDSNDKIQRRQSDNVFVRGFWTPAGQVAGDFSVLYAPADGKYFIANAKDSGFELNSGGLGLNLGLSHPLGDGLAMLSHRLTWSAMESSRDSDSTTWKGWRHSAEKDWGVQTGSGSTGWMSYEGGWGDIDQTQESYSYQLKSEWEPFFTLGVQHHLQAGIELSRQRWTYQRKTTYTQYTTSADTTTCDMVGGGVDTETCSLSSPWNSAAAGQYLRSRLIYFAGEFDLSNTNRAFFVQDEMRWGNLRLRLGARYDNDDLAPEATLAPRSALFWDLFGDRRSQLEVGANRYYARNFMAYHAQAKRLALQSTSQLRSLSGGLLTDWAAPTMATNWTWYKLGDMKVPYDDEHMIAFSQQWLGSTWTIKRVLRESRDEMVLHLRSAANYYWDNSGYSDARTWSLSVEGDAPVRLAGTSTTFMFSVDHTDIKTSHADYSDTLNDISGDLSRMIVYDGKLIPWMERPADNFARPWQARLMLNTEIPAARLSIGNFLRLRAGYEKMVDTGVSIPYDGGTARVWSKRSFSSALTWDMRLNWRLPVSAGQEAFVNLTIENVLNRRNPIEDSGSEVIYEKGRQFWLELGYRF